MAATVETLRDWLNTFPPTWTVYVDEGGLTLVARANKKSVKYEYELGGEPENDDE
jgi:hypothetical protein